MPGNYRLARGCFKSTSCFVEPTIFLLRRSLTTPPQKYYGPASHLALLKQPQAGHFKKHIFLNGLKL
jgi:hypothetical protein